MVIYVQSIQGSSQTSLWMGLKPSAGAKKKHPYQMRWQDLYCDTRGHDISLFLYHGNQIRKKELIYAYTIICYLAVCLFYLFTPSPSFPSSCAPSPSRLVFSSRACIYNNVLPLPRPRAQPLSARKIIFFEKSCLEIWWNGKFAVPLHPQTRGNSSSEVNTASRLLLESDL